jgi:hypothetical protein
VTRVTVTMRAARSRRRLAEVEAFVHERAGMTLGWTGSFDALEALVDPDAPV